MREIEACTFKKANFMYIMNSMWKHAPRTPDSRNNLIFVTEGVLYIEMERVQYTVKPGEFLFLPHGVLSIGYRPSGIPTGFFFAIFDAKKPFSIPTHFTLADTTPIRELYMQLIRAAQNADYPRGGVNALLHALLYEVWYQLNCAGPAADNSLAESVKVYLHETVFRNLTVSDVAAHFGFCPDYINRVFTKAEHMTIKAYITHLKIRRIEEYLVSTNTPVKAIAEKLNFPTPSALSKFYKYHTGKTPEEYRAKFIN